MDSKGKNIFDQMINAVSNRDEKAALEAAKQHMLELEQKVAATEQKAMANAQRADAAEKKATDLQAMLSKAQADSQAALAKAQADLQAARAATALVEQRANLAEAKVRTFESEKMLVNQQAAAMSAAKAQILATHTLTAKETLSDLALKYYGHATPPYWKLIYEANKAVIGDNPNAVRSGLVLNIPVLPDSMK